MTSTAAFLHHHADTLTELAAALPAAAVLIGSGIAAVARIAGVA